MTDSAMFSRLGILVVCLCAASARAAEPLGDAPTSGVYNPTLGVAGDSDASAVEKNPANLGELRSWSAVFLHTETAGNGTVGGRGTGLFVASPLPYLHSLVVGVGAQFLRPPDRFPFTDSQKLSLSLAWRPLPGLSFGLSYAHLWGQRAPMAQGIDTLDLAFGLRLGRWLGVAMVVRDVTSPMLGGLPIQRVYEPELALRPFGDDRVELGIGARFGERRGDVDPRFRLWVTPYRGLHVKADVEWRRDLDVDGLAENDVRVALGVQVDFERVGLGAFGLFGRDQGDTQGHGFSVSARVSGERYPALWRGLVHLEKVELGPETTGRQLLWTLARLRRLETDPTCAGVVVVVGELPGGWAAAEELHAALVRLRNAKKHVYSFFANVSARGYLVASAAEKVYADPGGGLRFDAIGSTAYFFKGTGDLVGVRADFVKIDEYKSAPEMYTRSGSSEPSKRQREALLDDTFASLTTQVAAARGLSVERVRAAVDKALFTPLDAARAGLVDGVHPGEEIEGVLAGLLGRTIGLREAPKSPERSRSWSLPRIAVITIDGELTDGKSYTIPILDMKFVGIRTLLPLFLQMAHDQRVHGIVLRVNSPGGSALAADLLAREIERLRSDGKPVVCSLGDVAASGGYYVAAPCRTIFAAPSTITGSIGIYTGKFDVSGLAAKLGVGIERFERGAHAGMETLWRPYSDEERALLLGVLRYHYDRFVAQVSRGRGLTVAAVDALGHGRVWSGQAAKARSLVDQLGGFGDALAETKRLAGLPAEAPVELDFGPDEPTLFHQLASLLGIELRTEAASLSLTSIPGVTDLLRALPGSLVLAPSTPQARLDW